MREMGGGFCGSVQVPGQQHTPAQWGVIILPIPQTNLGVPCCLCKPQISQMLKS